MGPRDAIGDHLNRASHAVMAKVLAVIGLLFFCVGIRFLFVKENQQHPAATIEISGASGAMSVVQVRGDASAIRAMIGAQ